MGGGKTKEKNAHLPERHDVREEEMPVIAGASHYVSF
jgi:hypothetical protein